MWRKGTLRHRCWNWNLLWPLWRIIWHAPPLPKTENKTFTPWKESYDQPRQHIKKRRHYFANKVPSSQFSSAQSLSHVRLFATPCTTACQASLPITTNGPKAKAIESVMPSNHFILYRPLLLLPRIPPSIRVFSNEPSLHMSWPKYWSFSFSIIPSNEHPGLISFRMDSGLTAYI